MEVQKTLRETFYNNNKKKDTNDLLDFKISSHICPLCGDALVRGLVQSTPCGYHKCHISCLERLQNNTLETPFCLECSLSSNMDIMSKMFQSAIVSFLHLEFLYDKDGPLTETIYLQSLRTYLLFLKLYHFGITKSAHFLGTLKQLSKYPDRNLNEAIKWLEISSNENNHQKSQLLLGKLYLTNKMFLEARNFLEKAASQNEPEAQFHLAMMERNNPRSLKLIEASLQNINKSTKDYIVPIFKEVVNWQTLARHERALYFKNGNNDVSKDIKLAKDLFIQGAQRGYINSQRELAYIYLNDNHFRNPQEAIKWFKKSGAQGDSKSILNLAIIYFKGDHGIKKNMELSAKYFVLAKNLGESIAISYLGDLYTFALEPSLRNEDLGIKFFKEAARNGEKIAQYTLGGYYHHGTHQDLVPKNISLAIHWYRKAAEQDYGLSQYHLGKLLREKGPHYSRTEALEWLRKASLNGFPEASKYMLEL